MKRFLLTFVVALITAGMYAADSEETAPTPVYLSLMDRMVYDNDVKWEDEASVTAFLKSNISEIPEGYSFQNYRTNTDIKGFTHRDCQQVSCSTGEEVEGCELIVHTDNTGRVVYITGHLWKKTQETSARSMTGGRAKSADGKKTVILIYKGKEHVCTVGLKNFKRVYTDVETGEVVKTESLLSSFDKATEADMVQLTGNPYFEDMENTYNPEMIGANINGKYVLQDPVHKLYTVDFTDNITEKNAIALGEAGFTADKLTEIMYEGTADQMIKYGDNFTSSTADFGSEHNALTARLKKIVYTGVNQIVDPATSKPVTGEFQLEVRKCNDNDFEYQDTNVGGTNVHSIKGYGDSWEKGTTLETAKACIVDTTLTFTFNNLELTTPCQERDTEFASRYHDVYISCLTYNGQLLRKGVISSDYMDHNYTTDITYGGEKFILSQNVQKELTKAQVAIDIHWGLQRTLDMYKDAFGMDSYNSKGSPVVAIVNYNLPDVGMPANAVGAGSGNDNFGLMVFGLGGISIDEASRDYPFVNISTIGHEFTHVVALKLTDSGEAKALNESYADIMGKKLERTAMKEHYYMSGDKRVDYVSWDNFTMITFAKPQVGYRCFNDPWVYNNPKFYKGLYWDAVDQEEHCNAGVQNYWFYLLCTGGEITNEKDQTMNITAIPRDSAELIAFSSLMYFTTKSTTYSTARKNSICAAKMYFGENSQEVESVLKAWYAVGVGQDEWKPGDPASIDAVYSNSSVCSPVSTRKVLRNNRIVIEKNGKRYNAVGQQL